MILIENSKGIRTPFKMDKYGCDKIKLDHLVKSGVVYHVIRTDSVEVIRIKKGN